MNENAHKPDYKDFDWTALIRDRQGKWTDMQKALSERGIRRIDLWDGEAPVRPYGFHPGLWMLPVHRECLRGTLIVCAGGGFRFKSSNEALPVAEYFHKAGLNAAILDYSVNANADFGSGESQSIQAMAGEDGSRAVRWLRCHAKALGIDPDKIAIGGFSAGGMVAAWAASRFDAGCRGASDPMEQYSSRPDAALLIYSSFPMALTGIGGPGGNPYNLQKQRESAMYATDAALRPDCPPFFLVQTTEDDPRRCLLMGMRLAEIGIPFEVHLFGNGPHGGGLYDGANEDSPCHPHTKMWAEVASNWLIEDQKF